MSIKGALRIFRIPNLLMVAVTMYLIRLAVIKPILIESGASLQVSGFAFFGLVLSTVLITAAGYVINDYHDVKADRINKPKKMVIGIHVSRRTALLLHWILNLAGVSAGALFSVIYHVPWMILIFAGAPLLLWVYSVRLKHLLLAGNLAVSLLTATVPLLVLLFEYPLLSRCYPNDSGFYQHGLVPILLWVGTYAFFAFMTNLIREIIKDAQDMEGDKEQHSTTIPIVWGIKRTRQLIIALILVTVAVLGTFSLLSMKSWIRLAYILVALLLPFFYLIYKTTKARTPQDFKFLSQWIKLIMLLGLMYALVHWLSSSI